MAKIKLKHGAPQLRFIRAEVVAGAFDAPQNQAQAEAEAAKFTPGPGGIFTFSNIRQVVRNPVVMSAKRLNIVNERFKM